MFGHLPSYERIEVPHQQVHEHVHEVLALAQGDWHANAGMRGLILQKFEQVEAASSQLIKMISELLAEKRRLKSLVDTREVRSDTELF